MMPFATPAEMRAHVRECVETLYLPEGGLGLSCEIGPDVPWGNIAAAVEAVDEWRLYKG